MGRMSIAGVAVIVWFMAGTVCADNELTVVFTANSKGKLRACNCPNDPYGGLAERVTLLKELRKKERPFLLLDGGGMVSLFGQYDLKARSVMRLMSLMKYDAAGTGCFEFFRGVGSARMMGETAEFPLLAATIVSSVDSTTVFEPWTVKKIGSGTVGIISVCDSTCLSRLGNPPLRGFYFIPVEEALRRGVGELSARCDFLILLSRLSHTANVRLAGLFPEIDLVVESTGNKLIMNPDPAPHGIIVSPGDRGKFVGIATLMKSGGGTLTLKRHTLIPVLEYPEDKKAHAIVMDYYDNIE